MHLITLNLPPWKDALETQRSTNKSSSYLSTSRDAFLPQWPIAPLLLHYVGFHFKWFFLGVVCLKKDCCAFHLQYRISRKSPEARDFKLCERQSGAGVYFHTFQARGQSSSGSQLWSQGRLAQWFTLCWCDFIKVQQFCFNFFFLFFNWIISWTNSVTTFSERSTKNVHLLVEFQILGYNSLPNHVNHMIQWLALFLNSMIQRPAIHKYDTMTFNIVYSMIQKHVIHQLL